MNVQELLSRLEHVSGGQGKWMACCPAHLDKSPSLAVSAASDRVLIHCFAGCVPKDITAAIGLNISDLFYNQLAGGELTQVKRCRFEEVLKHERLQVAIINSAERIERPLTPNERQRRTLGQQRIMKIEGALYE